MDKRVLKSLPSAIPLDVRELLEFVMKTNNWSWRDLAEKLGTSHQRLHYWAQHGEKTNEVISILRKLRKLSGLPWGKFEKAFLEDLDVK